MKFLKIAGLSLIGIIALAFFIALFIKKDYAVERQIIIKRSTSEVFDYVKYLKNQDHYSKWATMDPEMKKEYRGIDGTVGFVATWDSKKKEVGKGEQEILKITEGERIDFELRFYEPFESTDNAYLTCQSVNGNETKVSWGFTGKMKYPMNLMFLCMNMDEMLGNDLQLGLEKLKSVLEN